MLSSRCTQKIGQKVGVDSSRQEEIVDFTLQSCKILEMTEETNILNSENLLFLTVLTDKQTK